MELVGVVNIIIGMADKKQRAICVTLGCKKDSYQLRCSEIWILDGFESHRQTTDGQN